MGILVSFGLEANNQTVKPTSYKENAEVKNPANDVKNNAADPLKNQVSHKDRVDKLGEPEPGHDTSLSRVALLQQGYVTIDSVLAGRMTRPSAYQAGFARESGLGVPPYFHSGVEIFYEDVLDSVRDTIGDTVYSKLLWTYYDIKEIDNLIYAKMAQYDFSRSVVAEGYRGINGLNHQFGASIMVGNSLGVSNGNAMFQDDMVKAVSGSNEKAVLNIPEQNFGNIEHDTIDNSYFAFILRIRTITNIIYAMLAVFLSGLLLRVFRFFIKQDLS
ncbi:hypothetical protein A1507_09405 [Methylomonas koyamae]|uniref:Uncharacterized protein n=2 Tax=Methylomonas koyamae TaxID=702114 RepID=A0A177NNG1_9GAMM|nr:hypothetical protein A1507_09405 [Methylomonas koyamae]